jgi:hypothetical protein
MDHKISLANVRHELKMINSDLQRKCNPAYNIQITQYRFRDGDAEVYDESSEGYDIILCLYHRNRCISSITGRYNKSMRSMEVLSKTSIYYEGLKFNLYLRAVFMYLMCFIRNIDKINSYATNPISTYAMYKYFHAKNNELEDYTREHKLTPENFTIKHAKGFHTYYAEINKMTYEKAEKELELIKQEGYKIDELFGAETEEEAIEFIMNNYNDVAIPLTIKLDLPGIKEFLLSKVMNTQIRCSTITLRSSLKTKTKTKTKTHKSLKSLRKNKI